MIEEELLTIIHYSLERFKDCRRLHHWRRISADDGDDFISLNLQTRMEPDHDVVGEHPGVGLLRAASLQGDLYLGRLLSIAADLTGRVSVQLCVDNSVKFLLELKIYGHEACRTVQLCIGSVQCDC